MNYKVTVVLPNDKSCYTVITRVVSAKHDLSHVLWSFISYFKVGLAPNCWSVLLLSSSQGAPIKTIRWDEFFISAIVAHFCK